MDRPHVRWGLAVLVMVYLAIRHPIMFGTAVWRAYKEAREQLRKEGHGQGTTGTL